MPKVQIKYVHGNLEKKESYILGSGYICSEYKVLVLSTSTISQIVLLTYYVRQPRKAKISMKSAQWYFVSQIVLTYSEKKKCSNVFENLESRTQERTDRRSYYAM